MRAAYLVLVAALALISMCTVAWRIDLLPLRELPPPEAKKAEAAEPKQSPPAAPDTRTPQPLPQRNVRQREDVTPNEPENIIDIRRAPLNIAPLPSSAKDSVALDMNSKRQRTPLSVSSTANSRVHGVAGQSCTLEPSTGSLDGPVKVRLAEGRVTLTVSLITKETEHFIEIEPTVRTDGGKDVPFTIENLERIGKRQTKDGRRAASQLSRMQAEKAEIEAWLASPGLKTLAARNKALARFRVLERMIPAGQQAVAALQAQVKATTKLYELAKSLDVAALELETPERN